MEYLVVNLSAHKKPEGLVRTQTQLKEFFQEMCEKGEVLSYPSLILLLQEKQNVKRVREKYETDDIVWLLCCENSRLMALLLLYIVECSVFTTVTYDFLWI